MKCPAKLFFGFLFLAAVCVRAETIQDGNAAFAKGEFAAAIRAFESALATQGPSAGLYYSLGVAQQKEGQRPQAALNFRRAVMLDPRMVDARMALSEIERSQGVPPAPSTWRELVGERMPLGTLMHRGMRHCLVWSFPVSLRCLRQVGSRVALDRSSRTDHRGSRALLDRLPRRSACLRAKHGSGFRKGGGYTPCRAR